VVSVYDFKPAFQRVLRPLLRALRGAGVTPNGLTLAALFGSVAVGAWLHAVASRGPWLLLLPAWLLVRMALNALDGMMAREYSMSTSLGAVLNEVGDVLSDAALYLSLVACVPGSAAPVIAFVLASVLTEFSGVLAQALGAGRRYEGPMGKSDRALLMGLWAVAAVLWSPARSHVSWVLWFATGLAFLTCANRLRFATHVSSREARS
jgi:CDP-diacylglycerol--glycerol-3-phosphate 3-phosphatidyltransferase